MKYQVNFGFHAFSVPSAVVDNLIRLAKEPELKTLLYLLRYPDKHLTAAQIAAYLKISEEQAEEALGFWMNVNILQEAAQTNTKSAPETPAFEFTASLLTEPEPPQKSEPKPEPAPNPVQKKISRHTSTADMAGMKNDDIAEQAKSPEMQKLIRRSWNYYRHDPNFMEVRSLVWMHDYLELPSEVILILLDYCREIDKFSVGYVDAIAYDWWKNEILTAQLAEAEVTRLKALHTYQAYIKTLFGVAHLSEEQKDFADSWQEAAYPDELIRYAREQALNRLVKKPFNYINVVLTNWAKEGVTTVDEAKKCGELFYQKCFDEAKPKRNSRKKAKRELTEKEIKKQELYMSFVNQFDEEDDDHESESV